MVDNIAKMKITANFCDDDGVVVQEDIYQVLVYYYILFEKYEQL